MTLIAGICLTVIKSQLEVKRKRGDYVGSFVPYGYKRNPRKRSQLIIDEEVAENIRLIFSWKMEGMTDRLQTV